jgi:inward rectifier potassium channel
VRQSSEPIRAAEEAYQPVAVPVPAEAVDDTADKDRDLGLGDKLAERVGGGRVLNQNGRFNVRRSGTDPWNPINLYHTLLTLSWPKFFSLAIGGYFAVNLFFALMFLACGPGALEGARLEPFSARFQDCFFFSIQTVATIGYGKIVPHSPVANFLVAFAALAGLLGFAFVTGLLFARFSRPVAKMVFSRRAVIAPYQGKMGLMFRLANQRSNELSEVTATVVLVRWECSEGRKQRRFNQLPLERDKISFLPWHWVVVHPIDEKSPLYGITEAELAESEPEILILVTAMDETFSQVVHTRMSYHGKEVVWNAKFAPLNNPQSPLEIDLARIHDIQRLG